jgi:uncharacterized protein
VENKTVNTPLDQPLSNHEISWLEEFLDGIGPSAMNIEMFDGYLTALICGPDMVPPSEYLPQIMGDDHSFKSDKQATEIFGLVMRHWNTIASNLARTLEKGESLKAEDLHLPLLLEDEDGVAYANDWATGFMLGVETRAESWQSLINSDRDGGAMLPMMMLAHEHDPDPTMRPPTITPEKRNDLITMMIAGVMQIYRYFRLHYRVGHIPVRRQQPKVGRNEFCPCGSGRKYKRCCGNITPTIH